MLDTRIDTPIATGTQVIEAVLYRLKAEALSGFEGLHTRLFATAAEMPGFVSAMALRGIEETDLFMDYVVWETLHDARSAAAAFEKSPVYPLLMQAVATVHILDHLIPQERISGSAGSGDVFEVAMSKVKGLETDDFIAKLPPLVNRVGECDGFGLWQRGRSVETPDRFMDVLQWKTLESAKAAAERIHATAECQAVFEHVAEDELFAYFEPFNAV